MWEKFYPDLILQSIYDLDANYLKQKGIRGIILDLDNTLVPLGCQNVAPRMCRWVNSLKEEGFKLYIVSNSTPGKGGKLAQEMDVSAIWYAVKPRRKAFRLALQRMGLEADEVAVIGDQVVTDVLGGNRLGLLTILVEQMGKDMLFTRVTRMLERRVLRRMEREGLYPAVLHKKEDDLQ